MQIIGDALIWAASKITEKVVLWLAGQIIKFFGFLIQLEAKILAWVVDINHFTTLGVVQQGWKICRDFANLFFIAILIYIAFSLILKLQKGDPKKLLFKVIAMAIIINFSLMIGGIIIDFSQVLFRYFIFAPLTEKNGVGFSQQLANQLVLNKMLGSEYDPMSGVSDALLTIGDTFLKMIFIIIFFALVSIVFGSIALILLIRNFWLWMLLILSPLAWFLSMVPVDTLKKYASQWWSNFLRWCFMAPIMGFFVFLSFMILSDGGEKIVDEEKLKNQWQTNQKGSQDQIFSFEKSQNTIFNPVNIFHMITSIAFLEAGLMAGQSLGSGVAKGAMGIVDKAQKGARNWAKRKTMQSAPVRGAGNALMGMKNIPLVGGAFKRAGMATQRGVAAAKGEEAKRAQDRIKYMNDDQLKKNFNAFNEREKMEAAKKIGFDKLNQKQFEDMQKIYGRNGMEKEKKDLEKAAPHFTGGFAKEAQGFNKAREELSAATAALQANNEKIAKLEQEKAGYKKDYEEANQLKKDENGDFVIPDEKELEKKKQKIETTDAALKQAKLDAEPLTEKIKQSKQKFEEARAPIAERFQDVDLSKLSGLSNIFKEINSPQAQSLIDVMAHKSMKSALKAFAQIKGESSEKTAELRRGVATSMAENLYLDGGAGAVAKLVQLNTSPGAQAGHYDFASVIREMKINGEKLGEEITEKIENIASKKTKTNDLLDNLATQIQENSDIKNDESKDIKDIKADIREAKK